MQKDTTGAEPTGQAGSKPLGHRSYGRIPHLPGSRQGRDDIGVNEGQARICTEKARDADDIIIVQEKVDGSCVAAAMLEDGQVVALGRAGHLAQSSKYEQHQLWAAYVRMHWDVFHHLLIPGERIVGEWLAQAHGTRYALRVEPFAPFDIMIGNDRLPYEVVRARVAAHTYFKMPALLSWGAPCTIEQALVRLGKRGYHGALDPVEGAVWRVERKGTVDFLAKFVRPGKVDGLYLPEVSGQPDVWNWRPEKESTPDGSE